MKKKDKAFGFFVNFDKEEIYFSRTFIAIIQVELLKQ